MDLGLEDMEILLEDIDRVLFKNWFLEAVNGEPELDAVDTEH